MDRHPRDGDGDGDDGRGDGFSTWFGFRRGFVSPGRGEGAACAAGRAIKIFPPLLSARGYTASSHARPSQSGVGQGYTRVRAEAGGGDDGSIHRGAGVNASGGRRERAKRPREGGGMARERARRTLGPARAISPALFSSSPREPARVSSAAFASGGGGGRWSRKTARGRADFFEIRRGAAKGDPVSMLIGTLIGARSHFGLAFFVSLSISPMDSRAESDSPARVTGGCFPPRRFSRSRPSRRAHSRLAHEPHGTHGG